MHVLQIEGTENESNQKSWGSAWSKGLSKSCFFDIDCLGFGDLHGKCDYNSNTTIHGGSYISFLDGLHE